MAYLEFFFTQTSTIPTKGSRGTRVAPVLNVLGVAKWL